MGEKESVHAASIWHLQRQLDVCARAHLSRITDGVASLNGAASVSQKASHHYITAQRMSCLKALQSASPQRKKITQHRNILDTSTKPSPLYSAPSPSSNEPNSIFLTPFLVDLNYLFMQFIPPLCRRAGEWMS